MKLRFAALALFGPALLAGCYAHSFPSANTFIIPAAADCSAGALENCLPPATAHVFVDANGTFYPSGWREYFGPRRRWPAGSLLNQLARRDANSQFREQVAEGEGLQLGQLHALGEGAERIFILVHGYNNTVAEADQAYRMIESRLDRKPTDRVVRFYWDGLTGSGAGPLKIWFNAVGNSQLAGTRGLRRVLNQFEGKKIYLIGHSRGTSVILSALSDPPYDPVFKANTEKLAEGWTGFNEKLFAPQSLAANGNEIHVIVLAPAVDRIDFCRKERAEGGCPDNELRTLDASHQVKSFRYSINRKDPILRKFVGLTGRFNPTGLGTDPGVGQSLGAKYDFLKAYCVPPEAKHPFTWYVRQPVFAQMLKDAGIGRLDNSPADLPPPPPWPCDSPGRAAASSLTG
jgi:hypothetical protein